MDVTKITTLIHALTEKEAAAVLPLIEMIIEDIRDFKAKNGWHYVSEEGLPEAGQYYFIAYQTVLGLSGDYCKLIEKTRPIVDVFESTITGYETIKMWECEDSETMAWLNERGRVYAWMPLPALPEVK